MITNYLQGIGTGSVLQVGPNPGGGVFFVKNSIGADNRGRVTFPGATASTTGGSLQGPQMDPTRPLATLAYALSLTVAGRGDVVVLLQDHTETLTANVTCSTSTTQIVGLGNFDERPQITSAGFKLSLTGAGCSVTNLAFLCSTTAVFAVELTGAGTSAVGCRITASNTASIPFALTGANSKVVDCEVDATVTGVSIGVAFASAANYIVQDCRFYGIFATAAIDVGTGTNFLIKDNRLLQVSGTVKPVIAGVVTASSGLVVGNTFQSVAAVTPAEFIAGTNVTTNILVIYVQNFGFKGKAGPSSGILIPAVGTIP